MDFDFIIVGAGSAGCVLADRLSADRRHSVLVVEAGGADGRLWIKVPVGYRYTFADPRVNWCYATRPDPGLNGRKGFWPRGRVIGGSSAINAMVYVRGLPQDFDDWEAAGADGWNRDSAQDAFARLERHCEPAPAGSGQRLRGDGQLTVSDLSRDMHPFTEHFFAAARDLGWPVTDGAPDAASEGLGFFRGTIRGGRRCSAADAFLHPARARSNLRVMTHAAVERLIMAGRAVTGVRFRHGGRSREARARAEVILCAGAVNSPQLLQVSGIGPGRLLQDHGIGVVADLPRVGRGLQDHLAVVYHFAANRPTLNDRLGRPAGRVLSALQYLATRGGPLSVPVNQVGGFVRSTPEAPVPDVQIYCNPASYSPDGEGGVTLDAAPGFLLSAQPCRPTSRGEIRVASADPRVPPEIRPNSLSTEADCAAAVGACRLLAALADTPSLRQVTRAARAPDVRRLSDGEMLDDFRARAATNFHPCGTCAMGTDAATSVLDARLRVHGVAGLRVVDASAFPNITSGNTNAPTMMLAMRAADLILDYAASGATRRAAE